MERCPIPIAEALPDHGATVLAYPIDGQWWQANFYVDEDGGDPLWLFLGLEEVEQAPPTHWMPMPRAPKD